MANFVLIHAAWHGGWEWQRVAGRLRARGHAVYTPTMTGLGDRAHLLSRDIGLETHVLDYVNTIRWEELADVVLCGHSYGGTVATAVADRVPERIRAVVFTDAFVAGNGQSTMDMTPAWRADEIRELAQTQGEGWYVPAHHSERWVADPADRAWLEGLVSPHPYRSFVEPVNLSGGFERVATKVYVLSSAFKPSPFWQFYDKFVHDTAWQVHQLPTLHDAMISMPDEVAAILEQAARP